MKFIEDLANWRPVMDQPVGKAVLYSAGFGLSRGLSGLVQRWGVPGQAAPVLLAVISKLDAVEDIIGSEASELLATTAWIDVVTSVLPIGNMLMGVFTPTAAPAEGGLFSSVANLLKAPFRAVGLISDVDTLIPIDQEMSGVEDLTTLERKFAGIRG